ncbi:MAG: HAD-IIB family hydrolase, partial [Candidatus Omnitrophica bacterium]|nr:HAD-IIB family hydrolase [Candidatus Omnitrophota bacterium]
KLFGQLFTLSDDLPSLVTGQDNLSNILYVNAQTSGRAFFWEVLVFQALAEFDLKEAAEKILSAREYADFKEFLRRGYNVDYGLLSKLFSEHDKYRQMYHKLGEGIAREFSFARRINTVIEQWQGKIKHPTYRLSVPASFLQQIDSKFGPDQELINIDVNGLVLDNSQGFIEEYFDILSKRLAELQQLLSRAPPTVSKTGLPELSSWRLVISTDSNLTQGNIAACDISNKTLYLHPYFFSISSEDLAKEELNLGQLQLKIIYHELVSHIVNHESDEAMAMEDTNDVMSGFYDKDFLKAKVVVVAGPPGVGKSSLIKRLIQERPETFAHPITITTQAEQEDAGFGIRDDDKEYVSSVEFMELSRRGILRLQVAEGCQQRFYGIKRKDIDQIISSGKVLLLEAISQKHVNVVKNEFPGAQVIFISPVSLEEDKYIYKATKILFERIIRNITVSDKDLQVFDEAGIPIKTILTAIRDKLLFGLEAGDTLDLMQMRRLLSRAKASFADIKSKENVGESLKTTIDTMLILPDKIEEDVKFTITLLSEFMEMSGRGAFVASVDIQDGPREAYIEFKDKIFSLSGVTENKKTRVAGVLAFDVDKTLAERKAPLADFMLEVTGRLITLINRLTNSCGMEIKMAVITGQPLGKQSERLKPLLHRGFLVYANEASQKYAVIDESGFKEDLNYRKGFVSDSQKEDVKEAIKAAIIYKIQSPKTPEAIKTGLRELAEGDDDGAVKFKDGMIEDRVTQLAFKCRLNMSQREYVAAHIRDELKKRGVRGLNVRASGETTVSIYRSGVSKATAISDLMESTGIFPEDIIYFGDEFNLDGNDRAVTSITGLNIVSVGPKRFLSPGMLWLGEGVEFTAQVLEMICRFIETVLEERQEFSMSALAESLRGVIPGRVNIEEKAEYIRAVVSEDQRNILKQIGMLGLDSLIVEKTAQAYFIPDDFITIVLQSFPYGLLEEYSQEMLRWIIEEAWEVYQYYSKEEAAGNFKPLADIYNLSTALSEKNIPYTQLMVISNGSFVNIGSVLSREALRCGLWEFNYRGFAICFINAVERSDGYAFPHYRLHNACCNDNINIITDTDMFRYWRGEFLQFLVHANTLQDIKRMLNDKAATDNPYIVSLRNALAEPANPKTYPARLAGESIISSAGQLDNLKLYFRDLGIIFVDQTLTGKIADIETNPGRISVLKSLASRAPPFNTAGSASQSFQIFIDDIIRHETKELETGSHNLACQESCAYFQDHQEELSWLLEAVKQSGIDLDAEYLNEKEFSWQKHLYGSGTLNGTAYILEALQEGIKIINKMQDSEITAVAVDRFGSLATDTWMIGSDIDGMVVYSDGYIPEASRKLLISFLKKSGVMGFDKGAISDDSIEWIVSTRANPAEASPDKVIVYENGKLIQLLGHNPESLKFNLKQRLFKMWQEELSEDEKNLIKRLYEIHMLALVDHLRPRLAIDEKELDGYLSLLIRLQEKGLVQLIDQDYVMLNWTGEFRGCIRLTVSGAVPEKGSVREADCRNTYKLGIPEEAWRQADGEFGVDIVMQARGFVLQRLELSYDEYFEVLRRLLKTLGKYLDCLKQVPARWEIVVTRDIESTRSCVAACDIDNKVIYLHPYFFHISAKDLAEEGLALEELQLKIMYHELFAHLAKGIREENEAMKDTLMALSTFKAIKDIHSWKSLHRESMNERCLQHPFMTSLQEKAQDVYSEYELFLLPVVYRLVYINAVFDRQNYPKVYVVITSLLRRIYSSNVELNPKQYYLLAGVLSDIEAQYSIADNRNIRFSIMLILDLWESQKRILEQLYIIEQIDTELDKPGSGQLPVIAAIQDMHGGARRAMGLIGFVLGLPDDIYTRLKNLDDLKALLAEEGIEAGNTAVRFVGLNDKYDRGSNPEGVFELVSWLRKEGKAKPFIGNHDFWRTMAVLGVDRLFIKRNIDLNSAGIKSHHIAYWTHEAFHHPGWGDIELEQVNQRRFNLSLAVVNRLLKLQGLKEFAPVSLSPIRAMHEKDLSDAKKENARIRQQNELRKDEPGYVRQPELHLVDVFTESLRFLRQRKQEYNQSIREINAAYLLDIPEIEFPEVNLENFWRDPEIIERALWELKNFRIFYVDILGNLHMHNIMPVDYERGEFIVGYKGMKGLPALELMCEDVRVFFQDLETIPDSMAFREKMWQELGEAFSVINSWYSDIDVHAKAVSVQKFVENGGLEGLGHEALGHIKQECVDRESTFLVVWGHNERKKFTCLENPFPWIYLYPELQSGIANIDFEMSEGYSDRGAVVTLFMRDESGMVSGLRRWGYPEKSSIVRDMTFEDTEGIGEEQLAMLRELSDGKSFMRWYKRKALMHIIEEGRNIALMAAEQGRIDKGFFADRVVSEARINLELESEEGKHPSKTYPARLGGRPSILYPGQLDNLELYFKGREILFVAQTSTGKIADTSSNPGKISILKGLASRAPPFNPASPASKSFQILIDDIIRHETKELETGSHILACQSSYDYFVIHRVELKLLFEVFEEAGILPEDDYLKNLSNFILPREKAFSKGITLKAPTSDNLMHRFNCNYEYIERSIKGAEEVCIPDALIKELETRGFNDLVKSLLAQRSPSLRFFVLKDGPASRLFGIPRYNKAVLARDTIPVYTIPDKQGNLCSYITQNFYESLLADFGLFAFVLDHEFYEKGTIPHRSHKQAWEDRGWLEFFVDRETGINKFLKLYIDQLLAEGDIDGLDRFKSPKSDTQKLVCQYVRSKKRELLATKKLFLTIKCQDEKLDKCRVSSAVESKGINLEVLFGEFGNKEMYV